MHPDPPANPPPATERARRKTSPRSRPGTTSRALLAPLAFLYGLGARGRARRWRGRARRLPKPVLSVGNLTFGGTGKTPFVIHACKELIERGKRPGILSRGYRALGPEGNDEARVLSAHLPGVMHVQNPDRYAAGMTIAQDVDCFVLDDGFQHHPLARDADVVLVDLTNPFGGGFCPPAGQLREPLAALERASLVVLTRAGLVGAAELGETMRRVRARTAAPVVTTRFAPTCAESLSGREVLVACGIGNPRAFVATVESMGAHVVAHRFFRDHHNYDRKDVRALVGAGLPVVVTEKDAVKLEPLWDTGTLHIVRVELEVLDGACDLDALFDRFECSDGSEGL